MKRFEGKVVIVVGAAGKGNMGQCIARRFAGEDASVVVAGRHAEPLDQLVSDIGGASRLCDFTRKEDIDALVAFARERYGRVDVGINATGWGLLQPFEDTSEEELQAHAAYMGTKAGTDHVVRCVANEFGYFGIRANSISPGITRTPMSGDALNIPEILRAFKAGYPLGRIGTVDDVAEAALWLASDVCFMTGPNLQVNGGLTLRRNPTVREMDAACAQATAHLSA